MASTEAISLISHLMRRAGFGADRNQLEALAERGYEAVVEELVNPEQQPPFDDDLAYRYFPYFRIGTAIQSQQAHWMLRMISTKRPLEEKLTLFWHHVFATGFSKVENAPDMNHQLEMLREHGIGGLPHHAFEGVPGPGHDFLAGQLREPQRGAQRELRKGAAGAFFHGRRNGRRSQLQRGRRQGMRPGLHRLDHRPGNTQIPLRGVLAGVRVHRQRPRRFTKDLLGARKGRFNGEDIIDIICRQPSTARFICRHLYNFFVADEPQVPAWPTTPPQDQAALEMLEAAYFSSNFDIRSVLRTLFNSEFFKNARFQKIKSPAELVAGVMRLVDDYTGPKPRVHEIAGACGYMGQELLNPPTVEGWHTGREWIDSGALVERINFASNQVGDLSKPGVGRITNRLASRGPTMTAEELVDGCLELTGFVPVSAQRKEELIGHVTAGGPVTCGTPAQRETFDQRVARLLQLVVASREFQFA